MTVLIAVLSSGKGTWAEVNKIIISQKWDKIYLICSDYAYENFKIDLNKATKLKFNNNTNIFNPQKSFELLSKFFKSQIKEFEVALNLTSGSGVEHMALLSAILKAGLGVRFVYYDKIELKEFEILEEKFDESDSF